MDRCSTVFSSLRQKDKLSCAFIIVVRIGPIGLNGSNFCDFQEV